MRAGNMQGTAACFDLTDIVRYAQSNERVTGIQRVQVNLLGHLVRTHGGQVIRCVFHHPVRKHMVEVDASALFDAPEFDALAMRQRLRVERGPRWLPARNSRKRYLARFEGRKLRRALGKVDIFLASLFMPRRLAAMGLALQHIVHDALPLRRIDRLPDGVPYVFLSSGVKVEPVVRFAEEHAKRGGEVVHLVYDLLPLVHPEYFTAGMVDDYREWMTELRKLRPRAICISEWTAHDLRRTLGDEADAWDIHPMPMAHELLGFERNADVPRPAAPDGRLPDKPYVLCVGTLEVRKNGDGLLQAWKRLLDSGRGDLPMLVFAGRRGWLAHGFADLLESSAPLREHVHIVDAPSDTELAWLYRHSLFTAYPSHYEGWGLPVGESAWFGRYCIASRSSSIPEVCGELIDYVDPSDPDDIARRLAHALDHPEHVRAREAAIRAAPLRRWTDVADDILRLVHAASRRHAT
jgi:glycosyltransferase involved in cell wall biosynthesis